MFQSVISSPRPIFHSNGAGELGKEIIRRKESKKLAMRWRCKGGAEGVSDGDVFQEFRLWAGKSGLPAAVEAILIEEALAPGDAFAAEEDKIGDLVPPPPSPTTADGMLSDTILSVLFGAAAMSLVLVTVGVIYISVTDFLDNRKNEDLKKEAEKREKKELKGKKKTKEPVNTRAGPKGFGQSIRRAND